MTAFVVTSPVNTLRVPVTAFTATDNVMPTGYLITESASVPAGSATVWSGTAPRTYTATTQGSKALFAWAKDKAGNISAPARTMVTIDTSPPVIGTFTIPSAVASLTIPVTALAASDNIGVTGYLVSANATAPSLQAPGWTPGRHTWLSLRRSAAQRPTG